MQFSNLILVVDDSPARLERVIRLLREAGCQTLAAQSRAACREILRLNQVDLVLLEANLLDGRGVDICREIKAGPSFAHVLVVQTSGPETSSDERAAALEAGAIACISRPIPDRELVAHLQALLRFREEEATLRRSTTEQLHSLSAHLQARLEEERTRISREIHDELGQILTSLKMDLHWIEGSLEELSNPRVNPILDKLVAATELADATVRTVQRIASELRPGILDRLGLPMALRCELDRFQERTGIACAADVAEEESNLPPETATAFFRIFQEALTNVARHSHADQLEVRFHAETADFVLEINDNGKGILESEIGRGSSLGLLGMRERATLLGGTVDIQRGRVSGTSVIVRLPRAAIR